MKKTTLSFFQYRKQLRHELFIQRQLDRDNSKGYKLAYVTEWGKYRAKNNQQVGMADLICAGE